MQLDPELVPIMNRWGKYRTPTWVFVDEDLYAISIGEFSYRYFTEKTVPAEIKALLGMVRAFPEDERTVKGDGMVRYFPPDPRLEDIGWQIGAHSFMLVLPVDLLTTISVTTR